MNYPEHEKLVAARQRQGDLREFIGWLYDQDMSICKSYPWSGRVDDGDGETAFDEFYMAVSEPGDRMILRFLGIDENVLEQERRQMLEEMRSSNHV